jgi:membrane-associated phospholipid phosphatase
MMRSFPAGHFANALACATFWNERFHLGFAEPLLYALAGTVGVGRLADRAHWTSDTMLGGILGFAVGREVAKRSLERQQERRSKGAEAFVAPDLGGMNFGLRWSF